MSAQFPDRVTQRLAVLDQTLETAATRASALPLIDYDHVPIAIMLHCTIIEMTYAARQLFVGGVHSPVPVVLRTAYEALADQLAIARDPKHALHIQAQALSGGRSLPRWLSHGSPSRVRQFVADPTARDFMRRVKELEEEIAGAGGTRIEPIDKFNSAGLPDEYVIYRMLSDHVHNDGGVLELRHRGTVKAEIQQAALFRRPREVDLINSLDIAFEVLSRSCQTLYDDHVAFDELFERYKAVVIATHDPSEASLSFGPS